MAKPIPSVPDACSEHRGIDADQAGRLPLINAPPELPSLMAASVWMKFSNVSRPRRPRPVALTIPWRHGLGQAVRVADGEHDVANAELARICPSGNGR